MSEIKTPDLEDISFQQDEATSHTPNETMVVLREQFDFT